MIVEMKLRRLREAAAYSTLGKYSRDTGDLQTRPPARQLRLVLGDEPFKPAGVQRGWDAHHIIPTGDRRARVQRARSFRCRLHPNLAANGIYLRGPGLRKTRNGKETRAYRQLRESAPDLAQRTYHADTFQNAYFDRLEQTIAVVPEYCKPANRTAMLDSLAVAKTRLHAGNFGVERPGY
ncbi:AHH domain-containing protein [Conexibacter sp. SYSU D00693]|uniref:AHH domain-containing protein n=1 Tax=Conexibacter sp. SYSU D00693 TaxID=2812560 RepID=UPI00196A9131|nr:AHH domain-containing protein [Conexibacter sp. SYSU D00693]